MDNQELKNILIEELGSMPFKDKKLIKEEGTIPEVLLEKLILKNKKQFKFTKIMILVLGILGALSLFGCYWANENIYPFIFLTLMVLVQLVQICLRPGFIDNSKRELIFKLFKTMDDQELEF